MSKFMWPFMIVASAAVAVDALPHLESPQSLTSDDRLLKQEASSQKRPEEIEDRYRVEHEEKRPVLARWNLGDQSLEGGKRVADLLGGAFEIRIPAASLHRFPDLSQDSAQGLSSRHPELPAHEVESLDSVRTFVHP